MFSGQSNYSKEISPPCCLHKIRQKKRIIIGISTALIATILIVVPVLLLSKWNKTDKNEFVETTSVQDETSSDYSTTSITSTTSTTTDSPLTLKIISRNEWSARNPAKKVNLTETPPIVFINEASDFGACMTKVR